eukprot:9192372-Pyramimonas_sp.AAC.1
MLMNACYNMLHHPMNGLTLGSSLRSRMWVQLHFDCLYFRKGNLDRDEGRGRHMSEAFETLRHLQKDYAATPANSSEATVSGAQLAIGKVESPVSPMILRRE